MPRLRFAGQITGVEGYIESAAIGLLAGRFAAMDALGHGAFAPPPPTTALGALLGHITIGADSETFQPMNINFGLLPPLVVEGKRPKGRDRKQRVYDTRARGFRNMARHCQGRSRITLSADGKCAVDGDRRARDEVRRRACQEHSNALVIVRLTPTAGRCPR